MTEKPSDIPKDHSKPPNISEAEWLVMRVVWANAPVTAGEVIEALAPERAWKPKTVMTLLTRLVKKGALGFEKKGRAYHYHPLVTEESSVRSEGGAFLQRVYGGALKPMLANFLDEVELSDAEIEELKSILDQRRGQK